MSNYSLERIKSHLEKNTGDIGLKIFQTSFTKVKISEKPSAEEIERLLADLEKKLLSFYGETKSKDLLDKLKTELIQEQKSYESELDRKLNDFFAERRIPGESDINDLVTYLHSKGYKIEAADIAATLRQLSKDKVSSALSESIITRDVRSFLNRCSSYTQKDVGEFISYLRMRKLRVNDEKVMEAIEKERLLRKFNDTNLEESPQESICRNFFEQVNSDKNQYKYLVIDEEISKLVQNIADKGLK